MINHIAGYEQNMSSATAASNEIGMPSQVASAKAANAAALGAVSAGQVVTGEVSRVKGSEVQIKLPDDRVVTARLEANVKISAGQSMAFVVKSNSGSQIALTPLFSNTAVNPAAIRALGQASILVTKDSLLMASAMMDEGLGIDRNSLQGMFRTINKFPGADPSDIVAMSKQGIEITADNIEQFAAYRNNNHQIIELATTLADQISDGAQALNLSGKSQLVSIFNGDEYAACLNELTEGLLNESNEYELMLSGSDDKGFLDPAQFADEYLDDVQADNSLKGQIESNPNIEANGVLNEAEVVVTDERELLNILSDSERQNLSDDLIKLGISKESAIQIANGEMEPSKTLSYIQGAIAMAVDSENSNDSFLKGLTLPEGGVSEKLEAIRNITQSSSFSKLLKNAVMSDMSIKPGEELSKDQIKQLYERILRDTQRAGQIISSANDSAADALKGIENIRQNVSFMNQLNEVFNYVQLPIQLAGENAHGDLYVYTNKKKLSENDGNVTALLHLEMETLGTMDIHVAMKDYENVKTHFMLEKDEMIDFIAENIHVLDERLKKRGYNMSSNVTLKDEQGSEASNPVVSNMLGTKRDGSSHLFAKYSFDVKA